MIGLWKFLIVSEQDPQSRIEYQGDLNAVFTEACAEYNIGKFEAFDVVPIGYEDFNVAVTTSEGKYFAKVFASYRTQADINRYCQIIEKVTADGINHPHLYTANDSVLYDNKESQLSMVMMKWVEGETFYDQRRTPNEEELRSVLKQIVKINNLDLHPEFVDDIWSVSHIEETYQEVEEFLDNHDKAMVEQVIAELAEVDSSKLPHCFVHGDITKTNVIQKANGEVFILDFSVSNWYPRIQELAVIVGNLVNSGESPNFTTTLQNIIKMYIEAGGTLTPLEARAFPAYAQAAYAMEFLGASREEFIAHNKSDENDYWLRMGRSGLVSAFGNIK